MTEPGFDKLIAYLEGAFRERLLPNERDAYWLSLAPYNDAKTFEKAIEYVRSERSRFGFPKPGDMVPEPTSTSEWLAERDAKRLRGEIE